MDLRSGQLPRRYQVNVGTLSLPESFLEGRMEVWHAAYGYGESINMHIQYWQLLKHFAKISKIHI